MFQNISKDFTEEEKEIENKINFKDRLKQVIKGESILLYMFSFMLSFVDGVGVNYSIFAIAILAASVSNEIPVGFLFILTLIGTLLKFQTAGVVSYLFTSAILISMVLIFKPKKLLVEYETEKMKLGKFVFISVFLGQAVKMLFGEFLIYDLLISITAGLSAFVFYKIFSKSIIVINEIKNKKVFSIEELIGATLIVAISTTCFGEFKILGLQLASIINILIILILGWKNGILIGTTSGVTVGVVLGIITNSNPILIAVYATSGMLAGILSKFGKLGVIIGFIAGNLLLTYVYNGQVIELIQFKEILIASLALILVPNKIEINVVDLFGKGNILPDGPTYRLQASKETEEQLNEVSEVIKEMSNTYKNEAEVITSNKEIEENNKEIFLEEFQQSVRKCENNILSEDLLDEDETILNDIYDSLLKNQKINRDELLKIYENHNNYIVGFDNYETSMKIEKNINQIVNIANESFKASRRNLVMAAKIGEKNKNISAQLEGVSKVIDNIANNINIEKEDKFEDKKKQILLECKQRNIDILDANIKQEKTGRYIIKLYLKTCDDSKLIECPTNKIQGILTEVLNENIVIRKEQCGIKQNQKICYQTYISKDKYKMQIGMAKIRKDGETVSGDSNLKISLEDGKYLLVISDGMGSGTKARESSQIAVKMLGRLLSTGFDKETSIEMINNTISANTTDEIFATLDIMVLDLYSGTAEFIKNGACPTFIKNKKNVDIIKNLSIPAGILNNIELIVNSREIEKNDIYVMCSDGILESATEYKNKEIWLKNLLEGLETESSQKIANIILEEAIDNNFGRAKDDMTVIVTKLTKTNA